MKKPIRIGVVGLGKIAQSQHLPTILNNPNFELAFVVDRAVKLDLGVVSYSSLKEALDHESDFDAISICTSPQVRFELFEMLLGRDCAILLEKPAAANYEIAREIQLRADASEACIFATWHSRFAAHTDAAKAWVSEHEIQSGRIEWRENAAKWHPGQDWIWRDGGFGVFDPGMNALSILTKIMPVRWSVKSAELRIPSNVETPNFADFTLRHEHAEIACAFEFHEHDKDVWTIALQATNGNTLELSGGGASLRINDGAVSSNITATEYERIYDHFCDLVHTSSSDCDLSPLQLIEEVFLASKISSGTPIVV